MIQPKIYINAKVFQAFKHWEKLAKVEVSALGKISIVGGNPYVHTITLLKQECTSAETEIEAQAINKAIYELREVDGNLSFWIHSHNTMGVFWSGTDYSTIKQFGANGYIVSVVTNNDGEIKGSIYHGGNAEIPEMWSDDVEIIIGDPISKEEIEFLDKEFGDKVTEKTYAPVIPLRTFLPDAPVAELVEDVPPQFTRSINSPIPKEDWGDLLDEFYWTNNSEPMSERDLNLFYRKLHGTEDKK